MEHDDQNISFFFCVTTPCHFLAISVTKFFLMSDGQGMKRCIENAFVCRSINTSDLRYVLLQGYGSTSNDSMNVGTAYNSSYRLLYDKIMFHNVLRFYLHLIILCRYW